jgi:replication factor C subunit 3/5
MLVFMIELLCRKLSKKLPKVTWWILLKTLSKVRTLQEKKDLTKNYTVVVLHEVDKLSKEAQHGLRRTMEKYMATCRLILCCNSTSKVIEPVRSRCLAVRVPLPTSQEVLQVLLDISKKEKITLPLELANKIVEQSERNLRRAILMLEATKVKQ